MSLLIFERQWVSGYNEGYFQEVNSGCFVAATRALFPARRYSRHLHINCFKGRGQRNLTLQIIVLGRKISHRLTQRFFFVFQSGVFPE